MTMPGQPLSPLNYASSLYYKPSGRFSVPGVLLAIVVCSLAAIVLGSMYAYIDLYNPCISVLTFLATAAFGAGVGWVTGKGLRMAHVRNDFVTAIVATIVALVALYASWVVWVYAVLQQISQHNNALIPPGPLELAQHPQQLTDIIRAINKVGVWSMGHSYSSNSSNARAVNGIELSIIWLCEAVCVVGIAVWLAVKLAAAAPYCERCNRWCIKKEAALVSPAGDPVELRRSFEAKDFSYLKALGGRTPSERRWWSLDLYRCDGCDTMHAVSVSEITLTLTKKGQEEKKARKLLDRLLLSSNELAALTS